MNEKDLFLKSHQTLMDCIQWIAKPVVFAEKGSIDFSSMGPNPPSAGAIIETYSNNGILVAHGGLSQKMADRLLEAFLDSHDALIQDIFKNNATVVVPPKRDRTHDLRDLINSERKEKKNEN